MFHRTIKSRSPLRSVSIATGPGLATPVLKISQHTTPPPPVSAEIEEAKKAAEETKELLTELLEAVQELEARRSQSHEELRQAAAEIGMLVASRVVYEKLEAGDYSVEELINNALEKVDANVPITIQLNPNDLERLFAQFTDAERSQLLPAVTFTPNASLEAGACRVETPDFGLVTTVEQRLSDLRELLFQGLHDAWTTRRKPESRTQQVRRFPDRRTGA